MYLFTTKKEGKKIEGVSLVPTPKTIQRKMQQYEKLMRDYCGGGNNGEAVPREAGETLAQSAPDSQDSLCPGGLPHPLSGGDRSADLNKEDV